MAYRNDNVCSRSVLTLEDRVRVILEKEKGLSNRKLATLFKCGKTQITRIIQSKDNILAEWEDNSNRGMKRKRDGKYSSVNCLLLEWYKSILSSNIPINGPMLREKALEIAKQIGEDGFAASNGWLDRFRVRHNIQFRTNCPEPTSSGVKNEVRNDNRNDVLNYPVNITSHFLAVVKKAAAVKQEQSGEGESKQNHPSCSSSAPSFQDVGLSSTTENTEGNITGDLNKNEGDDENSILPMEVNLDDETEEPRDAQFNDTELDAEDPLNIDNTPTSTTVIETVPTPKIISTATVVNDDKPNEQKATGQNIHVRQNLTENPAPLPVVPVNPVRKRMQLKRPLPVSDILDGYNAKVSIEDEYKNYIDEDKAFLMSLLPAMKELTGPQKMEFKMTVLNELKRIRYPSSTPTPQTVGNLTVLPYAFQPIPNLANISHVIPIQQRTINPTTLQQVINKNSSTTQQTCKILSSQPPPLAAIIPQTVSATSAETAKQKQSPTVSSTATTAATVTAKPTPVEPPAKRASVSKDNNARSQPSATETKKTTSRRTPARRKPKKQAATNETQNNTEETQIITSDLTTPQDEEETRNDGELRTEIDLDEIKIEHIKVEPYDDEDTEDAMENC
ncbi:uncharacterized protein LOC142329169 isoform X4 [Lycorma delicatula]|uniref:uncharacterized protein LOC142329169 isoform X4 n=1 Tax=Lycorma delicatula TaxID=130591 RepID=UPI003F5152C0